jgi:hypothetical protein
MRSSTLSLRIVVAVALVAAAMFGPVRAQDRQAVPRDGGQQDGAQPRDRERRPPRDEAQVPKRAPDDSDRRAQPRAQGRDSDRPESRDRRAAPGRATGPGHYYFTPVNVRVRFHYHPYFGFYYGPYYGPYYPGVAHVGPVRFDTGAVRLRVKPVETEVYVNGYYAGVVDDFDGVLQRLHLPGGEHQIALRRAGYQLFTLRVRVRRGETLDIVDEMRRLAAGQPEMPLPRPRSLPPEWSEPPVGADADEAPASPYGILALRADPTDAQVLVDGEAWAPVAEQIEFVLHLQAGWHQIEVRRDGYLPFAMRVELMEGHTTRLDARLVRR